MDTKPSACLEITNVGIKLLIGYALNNQPVVLYKRFVPLEPGVVSQGQISKIDSLNEGLKKLVNVSDEDEKLHINVQNVYLVTPSMGLKVFSSEKRFNVAGADGKIEDVDITHLISLVKQDALPPGYSISDIIPVVFALEDGRHFAVPPLGYVSSSIAMKAMIHAVPEKMHGTHQMAVNGASLRVLKSCVSVYCAAKYLETRDDLPKDCIYFDMGAKNSDIALVGNANVFASMSFAKGGEDLTNAIAAAFRISREDADALKRNHGYCTRSLSYKPVLINGQDESGAVKAYYQSDLNAVISAFYETYLREVRAALSALFEKYKDRDFVNSIPFVISGGASKLAGLDIILREAFPNREITFLMPTAIGARDPGMVNLLGMLIFGSTYNGGKEDLQRGVATVARETKSSDKRSRSKSRSSVEDEL